MEILENVQGNLRRQHYGGLVKTRRIPLQREYYRKAEIMETMPRVLWICIRRGSVSVRDILSMYLYEEASSNYERNICTHQTLALSSQ